MFEIGSEFWTERSAGGNGITELIPAGFEPVYTISGRTALEIVIEDILFHSQAEKVYMPSYCCHTMIEPFLKHGLQVEFYCVYFEDGIIHCDYQENDCEIVFLMDYFGFIHPDTARFAGKEKEKGKTVIYDCTHAAFCETADYESADYVFGSFRKWVGINAGFAAKASAWQKKADMDSNEKYADLRNTAFDLKAEYINSPQPSGINKAEFLGLFQEAEELLERDYSHYGPDNRSLKIMTTIDVSRIRKRRRENAEYLLNGLSECENKIATLRQMNREDCPLFVPVFISSGRNEFRKYLIQNNVYLPVHWPLSELHRPDARSKEIYETEMSCICDQRYTKKDMDIILQFFRQYDCGKGG